MLQVKGLSKSFETHGVVQKALDGISVSFPKRGMVFVVGKSGSGKSTFLNMMAGFSVPDSGDVLFYGKSVTGMSERELDLTAAYYVSSLSPLLRFCSRFALAASFVSLCSYSVLLVMDNRYRIGVWKAIGYRGKSLSLYFLLCLVFFLLGTAVLYVCSAFVFDRLLNGILSLALYTALKCASRPPFVFLSFSVLDFLKELGVSFLLSALSELAYLFFFRKIRVDRVLRRKE